MMHFLDSEWLKWRGTWAWTLESGSSQCDGAGH